MRYVLEKNNNIIRFRAMRRVYRFGLTMMVYFSFFSFFLSVKKKNFSVQTYRSGFQVLNLFRMSFGMYSVHRDGNNIPNNRQKREHLRQ